MRNSFFLVAIFSLLFSSCWVAKPNVENEIRENENVETTQPVEVTEAQVKEPEVIKKYQPSRTKKHALRHTKLDIAFNWQKQQVLGEATISLAPYFYATNQLVLDAVYFNLYRVAIINKSDTSNLKFSYDSLEIKIQLDKIYERNEEFTIFIDYTANPEKIANTGNRIFKDTKGLYFINPLGNNPKKHQEIWTQGETQYSSCWFPTIDAPNQRCTQDIFITVDNKFTTLSNGVLNNTLLNADTTRTDHWVMDKPHAPYLFMIAVGEYEKIQDEWQEMDVSYYVHPEDVDKAKQIFDKTPEMIEFFSTLFDVEYPWSKYSQIVVTDFVSGAMENTTASVFGDFMVKNSYWYSDFDREMVVAHELAHHWFGNYITCESWANTVLNEGFATYSEYLWTEYYYGKYKADVEFKNEQPMCFYDKRNEVVNFYHENPDDMFGYNSYQKGAWILHNLRNYVGDEAFFEAVRLYLKKFAYKATEIHDLRLCFEEVTGEDLNWFFNQWYFEAGYPYLDFERKYDAENNSLTIKVKQKQDKKMPVYQLPIDFALHLENKTINQRRMLTQKEQIFEFQLPEKLLFAEIDPNGILLGKRTIETLTDQEYKVVLERSEGAIAQRKALNYFSRQKNSELKNEALTSALNSEYWQIRLMTIQSYNFTNLETDKNFVEKIKEISQNDKNKEVRDEAKNFLNENNLK